ncbi:hypothetical protein [Bacillus sp. SA1-12]|uniref:hypothetical protein n=1 Tax=Bacillus sp. SA1-12 TaxID=1455638 RepID=UPI00069724FF|nr:hypothetical protein [Bacillus sp. SA1-12]
MHFRHFIFCGFIAGMTLFFPADAFAEKNGVDTEVNPSQQLEQPQEKKPALISPQIREEENSDQLSGSINTPKQTVSSLSEKTGKTLDNPIDSVKTQSSQLREQASEKAQRARTSKVVTNNEHTLPVKPNKEEISKGQNKEPIIKQAQQPSTQAKPSTKNGPGKPTKEPIENTTSTIDAEKDLLIRKAKKEADEKNQNKAIISKQDPSEKASINYLSKDSQEEQNTPSHKHQYPIDIQTISSSQNTKLPGGSAKDRSGTSKSWNSTVEKWIEFEKQWNLRLIQTFVSKAHVYRNQWINAPPAKPPKTAPFFL